MRHSDTAPRLLIVPGLHDSGPAHWQTWLHTLHPQALRVRQDDWHTPALERWADRIGQTLAAAGPGPVLAVAHSFGCLALAQLLGRGRCGIAGALLVAPASPQRFGLEDRLHARPLAPRSTVVASDTDPWMSAHEALSWARRWDAHCLNLGDAGHINAEAGYGPLPLAAHWVRRAQQQHRRVQRMVHADLGEWSFAV